MFKIAVIDRIDQSDPLLARIIVTYKYTLKDEEYTGVVYSSEFRYDDESLKDVATYMTVEKAIEEVLNCKGTKVDASSK